MKNIELGKTYETKWVVTKEMLACTVGSGTLEVFSTPMMISLMENAAMNCIAEALEDGETSVGTEMNAKHLSASPNGIEVYAIAKVVKVEGKQVCFEVEAFDKVGKIGEATHTRFVLNAEKFMVKTNSKLS